MIDIFDLMPTPKSENGELLRIPETDLERGQRLARRISQLKFELDGPARLEHARNEGFKEGYKAGFKQGLRERYQEGVKIGGILTLQEYLGVESVSREELLSWDLTRLAEWEETLQQQRRIRGAKEKMHVIPTEFAGLLLIEPKAFGDERGFFFESYQREQYLAAGIAADFVQDNVSRSCRGTLRGLHYQLARPQGKLVFVTRGEVVDVAVDLRHGSPTFGRSFSTILNESNHRQLYVPPGFAHGFCVTSDSADFVYKCTDYYAPADERTLLWDDPALKIEWPDIEPRILSEKDQRGVLLSNAEVYL